VERFFINTQQRIAQLYGWSAEELALPALGGLWNGDIPTYAWDVGDTDVWQFEPSMLARLARRVVRA
jgi:hypothetical protein